MEIEQDKTNRRAVDILKVETYSERIHTRYSTTLSTSFAVFVGFIVILYTLLHDNLPGLGLAVGVLTAGTLLEIYQIRKGYRRDYSKISAFIELIGKNEIRTFLGRPVRKSVHSRLTTSRND